MAEYLLPCSCGAKTVVSTAQAGETIACACGARVAVPTLRGLRELEPAAESARPAARGVGWNDRHRLAFLILIAAAACAALSVYLIVNRPPRTLLPTDDDVTAVIDGSRPGQVVQVFKDLEKGISARGMSIDPFDVQRRTMFWGSVGAGVAAGVGLLAAALVARGSGQGHLRK